MFLNPFQTLTLLWMRSTWTFWVSISLPMSSAMLRRLPRILPTCAKFSSISSSLASFVTLSKRNDCLYTVPKFGGAKIFRCFEITFFCSPRLQLFEQKYSHVVKYHKLKQLFFYFNIIYVIHSCDSKAEFLAAISRIQGHIEPSFYMFKNKWKLIYSVMNVRFKRTAFIWSVFCNKCVHCHIWSINDCLSDWSEMVVNLWTRSQKFWHLLIYPPLMVIFSLSSTTREEGWLDTTPSWLFPQTFLYAPLASKSFSLRQAI